MTTTATLLDQVNETHATLVRYEARTGADWARDGFSLQAAQVAVEKARADYLAAFTAYAQTLEAAQA